MSREGVAQNLNYRVGSRQRLKFWLDAWNGEVPFSVLFPQFFSVVDRKEIWVYEVCRVDQHGCN